MCVEIPARVVSVDPSHRFSRQAVLKKNDGTEMTADLVMVPEARPGDYVVIHSGFAVSLLTEEQARQAIDLYDEIEEGDIQNAGKVRR